MKNNILAAILIILLLGVSCKEKSKTKKVDNHQAKEVSKKIPSLDLVWQTDSLLTTCEAVLYDKKLDVIYVANINNAPWEKDNNGFISIIDTKGNILELKWVEGLSGPKGMGVFNGKLYVNDIDRIVEIDIKSQKIINSYSVEGKPQLNDITISPEGIVYASGSNSNSIYVLENKTINILKMDKDGRLNGLLHQKEALFFADSGSQCFGIYDFKTNSSKILTEGVGHGDGVVRLKNGNFIVSNWKGQIFYLDATNWGKTLLLDTRENGIYAADIDYIPETQMLLVPTFFHNRVMSYKLNL
ncbi:NHL repeat-containing protein [Flavivirga algicola]|uniref:ATP-binding protein n=1 Tax=Flavivirga algicola TaxID=2729136 RepID=A0ABX1RXE5_9FLAO|nr:ATP-binding protein [Flavivirga algicola]NMH87348.1 ATP-binding protein [Flavivirga algicola]